MDTQITHPQLAQIAVGVDGTPESFAALTWAMREASVTGQKVHAIYGWTHSWDLGDEPQTPKDWERVRGIINDELRSWADEASVDTNFDMSALNLTSVHAAGTTALLDIGQRAHQIVVGRRTMNVVARWFLGSLSENLVNRAAAPVTVVRLMKNDDTAHSRSSSALESSMLGEGHLLPVVVGVDGSQVSLRALDFAAEAARAEGRDLHVFYCWQTKTLADYMQTEHAIPSVAEEDELARRVLDQIIQQAEIPPVVRVTGHAIHVPAAKGLADASHYAHRIIVGSRGLGQFDKYALGSVSQKLLDTSVAPVTVVH
ncbi:universal stress protein [Alloscardovia macacae]|nr:universal stress protein [Alloscardovia macacae]